MKCIQVLMHVRTKSKQTDQSLRRWGGEWGGKWRYMRAGFVKEGAKICKGIRMKAFAIKRSRNLSIKLQRCLNSNQVVW